MCNMCAGVVHCFCACGPDTVDEQMTHCDECGHDLREHVPFKYSDEDE